MYCVFPPADSADKGADKYADLVFLNSQVHNYYLKEIESRQITYNLNSDVVRSANLSAPLSVESAGK